MKCKNMGKYVQTIFFEIRDHFEITVFDIRTAEHTSGNMSLSNTKYSKFTSDRAHKDMEYESY